MSERYFTPDQIDPDTESPYEDEEPLDDSDLEAAFDGFINDTTETITVLGIEFTPADVLTTLDPVAYRTYFNDWLDGEVKSGTYIEG